MKRTNERGITLISLVITIIVLLILAGVAINLAVDSEGIFGKAGEAVNKWNTSVAQEGSVLENLLSTMDNYIPIKVIDEPTLKQAIARGGTITVEADIEVTEPVIVSEEQNVILNLNGYTISGSFNKSVGHIVKNDGILEISGGTISSNGDNGCAAIFNSGSVKITDTTLNGAPQAGDMWPSYAVLNTGIMILDDANVTSIYGSVSSYGEGAIITLNNTNIAMEGVPGFTGNTVYAYNSGKVIINGGNIENRATDQSSTGASVLNGDITVNSGTISGLIVNYYGTPIIKGGIFTCDPTRFLASGYKVNSMDDGTYVVVPEEAAE